MRLRLFLLGVVSIFLLSSPAKASRLESWSFDTAQNQLNITTVSGVKPRAFLIQNPTRLVIDLPGTKLNTNTIRKNYGATVREIRVGKVDDNTTRLVVELAPGYTVDPAKLLVQGDSSTHWIVKFPSVERVQNPNDDNVSASSSEEQIPVAVSDVSLFAGVVPLGKEIPQLRSRVQALASRYRSLDPGLFFLDLDTGNYLDFNGEKVFPAASTIKFPILIALFQEIDAGRIKLNETLVMRRDLITGGSGEFQYKRAGTRFSLLETATKMITISDNTATNMIIDRLGGKAKLNPRFRSWGLQNTVVRNLLGDFKGTNTTSAKDLVRLSALVANNRLLSDSSRGRVLNIMQRVHNTKLLPAGLGKGAVIAHKTGTLGIVLGDAGIIQMPSGKRYLAGIFVRRPFNDLKARDFINQVSRMVYGYLDQPRVATTDKPESL
ncbi:MULTISPECIES: serine hydrolase [Nostocales]|uniref:serine hydrolase n=1 Tax=Nostocales TaxID=1161 RepID=UPI0016886600|nr:MULTISPECIES: serine hydrolase [Nostocales]MBD2301808.1 serine hydrolase [Nostoc sp. FACHB-190]MBD2487897.1 serine hydrolase [Aulosira sp. FACHB-615]